MSKTILCLGFGYTAAALARRLAASDWTARGTARSAEKAAAIAAAGAVAAPWDTSGPADEVFEGVDAVLVSTPPGANGCPAFAAAADRLAARAGKIRWIGYLSSNGVYGDHGGAWVDEESDLYPSTDRARGRIRAEADWASHCVAWSLPFATLRLPGIYGPGRSAIDTVRAGRARCIFKEGQVFNRMHVDDIAAALEQSLNNPGAGDLFNLADDEPSPPQDVIEYACRLLGAPVPPLVPVEEAELSDMARSFYADNKRVKNDRMKNDLGVTLQYPTYREGLDAIYKTLA